MLFCHLFIRRTTFSNNYFGNTKLDPDKAKQNPREIKRFWLNLTSPEALCCVLQQGSLSSLLIITEPQHEIPTMWYVRLAKPQISLRIRAV